MTPEKNDPIENENLDDSMELDSDLEDQESTETDAVNCAPADAFANTDDPLGFGSSRMAEAADEANPAELAGKLVAAEARANDHWERLLLMQADMENQRKRAQKEVSNAKKFALESVVNELLPVRDSLEMGIMAAQQDDAGVEKILEGSELTLKMLSQAFEKYNIVEINPVGEKFDPEFHQAMSMQEIEGMDPNTVASVLQKGYTLNDRLIRPALVMVAK